MTYMIFLSSMILLLTIGTFAIQNSFADTTDFLENVPASIVRAANIVDTTSSLPIILELYTNNTDSTRAKQGDIITILLFMDTHFSNGSATASNKAFYGNVCRTIECYDWLCCIDKDVIGCNVCFCQGQFCCLKSYARLSRNLYYLNRLQVSWYQITQHY